MANDGDKPEGVDEELPDERSMRQRLEALIPDLVRKTVAAGLGAALATEEGIRKLASDLPLPKEVATYLLNTADSTKDRIVEIIAREVREFLQNVNLNEILVKTLTQLSFEIKTEIRFVPNEEAMGGVKPELKRKVSVKAKRQDPTNGGDDPTS
jgi:hypothetical protein